MEETKQKDGKKKDKMNPLLVLVIVYGIFLLVNGWLSFGMTGQGFFEASYYGTLTFFSFALPVLFVGWLRKAWSARSPQGERRQMQTLIEILIYLALAYSLYAIQTRFFIEPAQDRYFLNRYNTSISPSTDRAVSP